VVLDGAGQAFGLSAGGDARAFGQAMPTDGDPSSEVHGLGPLHLQARRMDARQQGGLRAQPGTTWARSEAPDGLSAGNKTPNFARVEWLYLPDSNSSVISALKAGEVDYDRTRAAGLRGRLARRSECQAVKLGGSYARPGSS
jgi:hypothetical protein